MHKVLCKFHEAHHVFENTGNYFFCMLRENWNYHCVKEKRLEVDNHSLAVTSITPDCPSHFFSICLLSPFPWKQLCFHHTHADLPSIAAMVGHNRPVRAVDANPDIFSRFESCLILPICRNTLVFAPSLQAATHLSSRYSCHENRRRYTTHWPSNGGAS